MGRGRAPMSTVDADEAHRFFDNKVAGVYASTNDAPPLSYMTAPTTAIDCRRMRSSRGVPIARQTVSVRCNADSDAKMQHRSAGTVSY